MSDTEPMRLVVTIDRDISPERLEEYKKHLNALIGYDGKWEIAAPSPAPIVEERIPEGLGK